MTEPSDYSHEVSECRGEEGEGRGSTTSPATHPTRPCSNRAEEICRSKKRIFAAISCVSATRGELVQGGEGGEEEERDEE